MGTTNGDSMSEVMGSLTVTASTLAESERLAQREAERILEGPAIIELERWRNELTAVDGTVCTIEATYRCHPA